MTFGTAVGEQGQSTHDSVQLTLYLKYQIKPIQLGTYEAGKLCAPLLQSHSSKENYNKFPLGTICDAQLALALALKRHKSFPLSHFIPSTPISGSKTPPPEILVPSIPGENAELYSLDHLFCVFVCVSGSKSTFVCMRLHTEYVCAHVCTCLLFLFFIFLKRLKISSTFLCERI